MAHSDDPTIDDAGYENLDEVAKEKIEDGDVDYYFESDSQPEEIDEEQNHVVDADGNKWRVRKVVIHVQPVVVEK
jgi:hypothetical protein